MNYFLRIIPYIVLFNSFNLFGQVQSRLYVLGLLNFNSNLQVDEKILSDEPDKIIFVFKDSVEYEQLGINKSFLLRSNVLKRFNKFDNKVAALFNSKVFNYMIQNNIFCELKIGKISRITKLPPFKSISNLKYKENGFELCDSSELLCVNTGDLQFVYNDIGGFCAFSNMIVADIALLAIDTILPLKFSGINGIFHHTRRNDIIFNQLLSVSDSILHVTSRPDMFPVLVEERDKWFRNAPKTFRNTPEIQISHVFPNKNGYLVQASFAWVNDFYDYIEDIPNILVSIQFDEFGYMQKWVLDPYLKERSFQYIPYLKDSFPYYFFTTLSPVSSSVDAYKPIGVFTSKGKFIAQSQITDESIAYDFKNIRKGVTIWHNHFKSDLVLNNAFYSHYSNYPFLFGTHKFTLPSDSFRFQYTLKINTDLKNNLQWIFLTQDNKVVSCTLDSNLNAINYKIINVPIQYGYNTDGHNYQYCFVQKNCLYCMDIIPNSKDINYLGYRLYKYKL